MKEVKYIPGDLVQVKVLEGEGYMRHLVVHIEDVSRSGKVATISHLNDIKGLISEENIKPVPLAEWILLKNGWVLLIENNNKKCYRHPTDPTIQVLFDGSTVCSVCQKEQLLLMLKNVHELQHLLFGLGLNHEMEV